LKKIAIHLRRLKDNRFARRVVTCDVRKPFCSGMISAFSDPTHQFSLRKASELPGVEVVRAVHRGPPQRWQLIPMVQIQVIEEGAARIGSCAGREVVAAGDTFINAPNHDPRIEERLSPTGASLRLYIHPDTFDAVSARVGGPPHDDFAVRVLHNPPAAAAVRAFAAEVERGGSRQHLEARLAQFIAQVSGWMNSQSEKPLELRPEVEMTRQLLHRYFRQPIGLGDLAHHSGLSRFHLLRLFREGLGITPHAYMLHLRIANARALLDAGSPVADVALRCGFADQSHFTRCFKSIVGISPGAFARLA
jgi:AraC-like DNA-binding protein